MPIVQRLYNACLVAFGTGRPPSEDALEKVRGMLDKVKPENVGLEEVRAAEGWKESSDAAPRRAAPIVYKEIYECDEFSMGIFVLPSSAAIPLHNHPGMTVLSKLLYGSMHVRSFNWAESGDEWWEAVTADCGVHVAAHRATEVENQVLTAPCETEVLFPHSRNIHSFTAVTPCAVLDVLAPPYDAKKGRHCTYFREASYPRKFASGGMEALRMTGPPAPPPRNGSGDDEAPCDGASAARDDSSSSSSTSQSRQAANAPMSESSKAPVAVLGTAGPIMDVHVAGGIWLEPFEPPNDFTVARGTYRGPKIKPGKISS
eukprot:TRINITY_DN652_c0_g1_i1.p1 TRINITY_DN652_c0_g1~~TRINITY_DN652_c0_g1_i1.p1  ORF type:complete len:316 (+),score=53.01 TRINITY_DN652_c0_g1_i1:348-1295(+)